MKFVKNLLEEDLTIKHVEFTYVREVIYKNIDEIKQELQTKNYQKLKNIVSFLLNYLNELIFYLNEEDDTCFEFEKKYIEKKLKLSDIFTLVKLITKLEKMLIKYEATTSRTYSR